MSQPVIDITIKITLTYIYNENSALSTLYLLCINTYLDNKIQILLSVVFQLFQTVFEKAIYDDYYRLCQLFGMIDRLVCCDTSSSNFA